MNFERLFKVKDQGEDLELNERYIRSKIDKLLEKEWTDNLLSKESLLRIFRKVQKLNHTKELQLTNNRLLNIIKEGAGDFDSLDFLGQDQAEKIRERINADVIEIRSNLTTEEQKY